MGEGDTDRTRLRLFVAASLPRSAVGAIAATVEPWHERLPGIRWVPPANLHLTLAFLGWTDRRSVPWVLDRVEHVARSAAPLEVGLRGLGAFPSTRRARVLWAGIGDERGRLSSLAGAVRRALASELPPERRAFTPHVTVARADPPIELPPAFARTALDGPSFAIEALGLVRSSPGGPSPRYETIGISSLGGSLG